MWYDAIYDAMEYIIDGMLRYLIAMLLLLRIMLKDWFGWDDPPGFG